MLLHLYMPYIVTVASQAICLFVPNPHCANRSPPRVVGGRGDGVGVTLAIKAIIYHPLK